MNIEALLQRDVRGIADALLWCADDGEAERASHVRQALAVERILLLAGRFGGKEIPLPALLRGVRTNAKAILAEHGVRRAPYRLPPPQSPAHPSRRLAEDARSLLLLVTRIGRDGDARSLFGLGRIVERLHSAWHVKQWTDPVAREGHIRISLRNLGGLKTAEKYGAREQHAEWLRIAKEITDRNPAEKSLTDIAKRVSDRAAKNIHTNKRYNPQVIRRALRLSWDARRRLFVAG